MEIILSKNIEFNSHHKRTKKRGPESPLLNFIKIKELYSMKPMLQLKL